MGNLQIRTEYFPVRCEICHQADCFDPKTNFCQRCADINTAPDRLLLNNINALIANNSIRYFRYAALVFISFFAVLLSAIFSVPKISISDISLYWLVITIVLVSLHELTLKAGLVIRARWYPNQITAKKILQALSFVAGSWQRDLAMLTMGALVGMTFIPLYISFQHSIARENRQMEKLAEQSQYFSSTDANSTANLIDNAGFDLSPFTNHMTINWQVESFNSDLKTGWTTQVSHSGLSSIYLAAARPGSGGWPGWFSNSIAIQSGQHYHFSAWVYSPDRASGWLSAQLLDEDGKLLVGYSTGCEQPTLIEDGKWHKLSLDFSTKDQPAARSVRLGLQQCLTYSEGRITTVHFDDLFFGRADQSVLQK